MIDDVMKLKFHNLILDTLAIGDYDVVLNSTKFSINKMPNLNFVHEKNMVGRETRD